MIINKNYSRENLYVLSHSIWSCLYSLCLSCLDLCFIISLLSYQVLVHYYMDSHIQSSISRSWRCLFNHIESLIIWTLISWIKGNCLWIPDSLLVSLCTYMDNNTRASGMGKFRRSRELGSIEKELESQWNILSVYANWWDNISVCFMVFWCRKLDGIDNLAEVFSNCMGNFLANRDDGICDGWNP